MIKNHLEAVGIVLTQHWRAHERENLHDVVQHLTGEKLSC